MFDEYIPDPPLICPVCGAMLEGWQGKDGPNALMIWKQGSKSPIDQAIDDEDIKLLPEQLATWRLPDEFLIYAACCGGHFFHEAKCYAADETWTRTVLITADTATQGKHESRGRFRARMRWLRGDGK